MIPVALLWLGTEPSSAACGQIDPLGLLPEDAACDGWLRDGTPRTADSFQELAQIIDGAAGLHDQYGFVSAAIQNYAGDRSERGGSQAPSAPVVAATLALFNQGTSENASLLYGDPASGMGEPIAGWGCAGEARFRVAAGSTVVQFREECFFGSITVLSGEEAGVDGARCLAERACSLVRQAVPVKKEGWGSLRALFR
ncbi:MAG: hypothetical protein HXY50_17365 [Ignavibacteriaceae bacterium]|nr:hypothetical protein [Ignavibacteriaceae bacterium]